jgi:hypothetical protein
LFIHSYIPFDALVCVIHQMGELIAVSHLVVALHRPYTLGLIGFQVLWLLQQD